MRLIVVGETYPQQNTTLMLQVWFRFPAKAGREATYRISQANTQPQAPGDYAGTDASEVADLQAGRYVERQVPIDECRLDPSDTGAQKQAKIVRAYNLAAARFAADEDAKLQFWSSAWDGTTWTMKSA